MNYKIQCSGIIFSKNQNRLNFKDFEKIHTILSRHKVIKKIKWKSSLEMNVTAPFAQSRTKAARFVGFWWEEKFKQENIYLFFWGSLNWY